jgi:hypothetical protein
MWLQKAGQRTDSAKPMFHNREKIKSTKEQDLPVLKCVLNNRSSQVFVIISPHHEMLV